MNPSLDAFRKIVKKHYPDSSESELQFFDNGRDHYIFVISKKYAFRFPRSSKHGEKDPIDNILLKEIAQMSPIKIPVFHSHQEGDIHYQTYDFISGVGLTKEVAANFSTEEKIAIGSLLGKFLFALNSFPIEKARALHMDEIISPEDYLAFFTARLDIVKEIVFPHLPLDAQLWIEKLFKAYLATSRELFQPKVTHFDMQPVHIIVHPDTHTLSGVIDFSLRIADPARDFMYFNRYGSDFLKAAYVAYGEKDSYFDTRRQFYAGEFEMLELEDAIKTDDKNKIEKERQDLLEYISEFPIV